MRFETITKALVSTAILAGAMLAWGSPAWAETFTVETTADSGNSSLRQAVADANATAEPDTIQFGLTAGDTITLGSTLTVTNPLTIEGHPTMPLTISGNNAVRPFYVRATTLDISDITIANGRVADPFTDTTANYGGAIFNEGGTLTIRGSALTDNASGINAYRGGAISNMGGSVRLIDSSVSGFAAFYGGAVHNAGVFFALGSAALTGSTLSGNFAEFGGAIYNGGTGSAFASVNVTAASRVDGNGADGLGGGIYNAGGAGATITDSTVSGNTSSDGAGGGVYTEGGVAVQRSTFSGNRSGVGGGLYAAFGSATITNSTFAGNESLEEGGGVAIGGGSATITNSTLSGNSVADGGGGVYLSDLATTAPTIKGSIIAGNTAVSGPPDVEGNYTNGGFNIIGGTAADVGLQTGTDGNPVLANNGGPTQTVALVRGGRAIDKGNSFGATADQRGTPRPKDYASIVNAESGDGSDVGAFEYVDPDTSAPTVEASPSPLPNENGLNNSDVTVAIKATDEEGGSGVWRVSYSASGAQQVSEQNAPGNSAELVISSDGETTVTYWATDGAGNRSESKTLTVRLDKGVPETSIDSGPSSLTRIASASFGFSSPEAGATFECKLDGGAFAPCASPKGYSALKDGRHTFLVRAIDGAGNTEATPAKRTWTVDTAKPTGKVLINGGKASTTSRKVTLRTTAKDPAPASGVASMRFKNAGTNTWTAWQAYATSKAWTLSAGAGKKTVYVQYRDRAGNISATVRDSITYRP